MKKILIIAGPNGAGKTTFASEFLPHEAGCPEFVNADLIADGLSPFRPGHAAIAAGRVMLHRLRELVATGESFAFETTLASRSTLEMIPSWQATGYRVELYFLRLPDPEFAIRRVARRVQHGGHHIPADTIRRRFYRGLENLQQHYLGLVDEWFIFDAAQTPARVLAHGTEPPSDPLSVMEEPVPYFASARNPPAKAPGPDDLALAGIDAALQRAAAKAIERDRAAGLEPISTELHEPPPK